MTNDHRLNTPMDSMKDHLERIRLDLLEEYERGGAIDIAEWAKRLPDYRDELLDYWIWLRGTTRLSRVASTAEPPRDAVAARTLERATEAITLGKAWLDDTAADEDSSLAGKLRAIRAQPYEYRGKAKKPFRKAAVYAWVALSLAGRRQRASRLATQKTTYFLERGLALDLFTDYRQKPFGPYDHGARYRDAEPIAEGQGWLEIRGASLEEGPAANKVYGYARRYIRSPELALRILDMLAPLLDAELETCATVDWAALQLRSQGERVNVQSIRGFLVRSTEWRRKLRKPNFSEKCIRDALVQLVRLGLIDLGGA
jgi:hypothetical protein